MIARRPVGRLEALSTGWRDPPGAVFLALTLTLSCIEVAPADTDGYIVNCKHILRNAVRHSLTDRPVSSQHLVDESGARHVVSVTYKDSTGSQRPPLDRMSCEYPADPFWWYPLRYGDAEPPRRPGPFPPCRASDLWPDVVIADGVEYKHDDDGVGRSNIETLVSMAVNVMSATGSGWTPCGPAELGVEP